MSPTEPGPWSLESLPPAVRVLGKATSTASGAIAEHQALTGRGPAVRWLGLPASWFEVPPSPGETSEPRRSLLAALLFSGGVSIVVWALTYAAMNQPIAAGIEAVYALVTAVTFLGYRLTGRGFRTVLRLHMVLVSLMPFVISMVLGGFLRSGGFSLWGLLGPMAALVFERPRWAWLWLGGFVLLLGGAVLADAMPPPAQPLTPEQVAAMVVLNTSGVAVLTFGLLYYFLEASHQEQHRADLLLLNVLPREIAERLKADPGPLAEHFDSATILFADIVGFTRVASGLPPLQVLELLNGLFSAFDSIVARHGLEKIKTIGDCYMIAAGVPSPRPDHAEVLVEAALKMQECVRTRSFVGTRVQMRMGIHSGPVAAGVIGRQRFTYDLWGDAVNVASRIEARATAGDVVVSGDTWELVKHRFTGERIGSFAPTGGVIDLWRIVGRKD